MMGVFSIISKPLDILSAAFIKPVETAKAIISPTKKISEVTTAIEKQSLSKNIASTIINTGVAAATLVGAGAVVGAARAGTLASSAGTLAKSLIPKTILGKTAVVAAAPIVVTAIKEKPSLIVETPSKIYNFQENVGEFIASPSIEKAKDIVSENPIITAAVGTAAAVAIGRGIIPAIATARQTGAIEEQTAAIEKATAGIGQGQILSTTQPQLSSDKAITPATQEIKEAGSITSKKRKKRSSKAVMPSIRQAVSVIVQNKSNSTGLRATKKYINKEVLLS